MQPIALGSQRELFVDPYLIDTLEGARPHLHEPVRKETVFRVVEPLENACTGCYNLVQADGKILVYYRGYHPTGKHEDLPEGWAQTQTTNLLVSDDGIHFERPSLGLVESEGSTDNNILIRGSQAHNFCVFLDGNPSAPPEQRFKAIGGEGRNRLFGFTSPDGLVWESIVDGPLKIEGAFDSVNVPLWDDYAGCYRIFSRYFEETGDDGVGVRAIQSCTSDDFIHWTKPEHHVYDEGVPFEHFYTNATTLCPGAEHILLSFPMRFVPERTKDTEGMDYPGGGISDAVFMTSRDGVHWDRTFLDAWLRAGLDQRNWTHRNQTPAAGIIPTVPDEWSMYVAEHYGWDTNAVRRVTVRPHGFASVRAGYHGGELRTKPVTFTGSTLFINYSTSAVGSMSVEIQDAEGRPLEGFAAKDMDPMFGDDLDAPVTWRGRDAQGGQGGGQGGGPGGLSDLSRLNGTPVRLRFVLKDADLFSIRFGDS